MNTPPNPELDALREWLRFAVPLRSAELLQQHTPGQLATVLPELARSAGVQLGHNGDALIFTPRTSRQRARTATAAADLATGLAAAALMAGPAGINVLGLHFAPEPPN
ncbi:hypothetical protein E1265_36430, partial [Streptomyces sp. 8K308]|uniref:hypothetical protein n=1 Tax=Streptomyces sp. 8K308 TaxID=2530388 RepID=UPI001045832D